MNYQIVILEFPNGKTRRIPLSEFEYYAYSNELEHKEENVIIRIDNLTQSFVYETDERGEIVNSEAISRISFI